MSGQASSTPTGGRFPAPPAPPSKDRTTRSRTSKWSLAFGGLLVTLLLAGVFTLGSLNVPFAPESRTDFVILFALSVFNIVALFVFGLILVRSLLRLWAERSAGQLGSRFKTKMVLGAMGISLLPVIFMFFASYALMNRTLSKWFPRPLEIATEESQRLLLELGKAEHTRLKTIAEKVVADKSPPVITALPLGADAVWFLNSDGKASGIFFGAPDPNSAHVFRLGHLYGGAPKFARTLPSGAELWSFGNDSYLAARIPVSERTMVVGRQMPDGFMRRYAEVEAQLKAYEQQKQGLRTYKNLILLSLGLFTVLLLFSVTWLALFLSKMVTVPIQALAEGTQQVSRGNFAHRVEVQAQDELGTLVNSFNQMTAQLDQSQQQINEFTRSLQMAVTEIEQRRKLMEAILENIPTAVLSLDEAGTIVRTNHAVGRIFGERTRDAKKLSDVAGADAARDIEQLMRKSLRMGTASKEFEIALPGPEGTAGAGRVLHAAVTVSSLGPRRSNPGYVVVMDDLSDLLRAQKAAAWQEVAQRIAHEIKNPLTPIQLSAQRLARHIERAGAGSNGELEKLVSECAGLIEREVGTLKSLVDEFSQFARFPTARPVPVELNGIVSSALDVFSGRLEGITVRTSLGTGLPLLKADPELLRRVVVNLIDNAAEALETSLAKELTIGTRLAQDGELVEIVVADTGHGISPEDKEKLFLPHFSTRSRGTGLGLAIASRIVAEHHGRIRVQDNQPVGARFVVQLPVAEAAAVEAAETRTN